MRSEAACQRELEAQKKDLQFWKRRLEGEADATKRKFLANTIVALEGRIEALEWTLEED